MAIGNGKIKKTILKFGLKFEKMWPYHEREMKKLKYVTKN
jgi:hypothetical protein